MYGGLAPLAGLWKQSAAGWELLDGDAGGAAVGAGSADRGYDRVRGRAARSDWRLQQRKKENPGLPAIRLFHGCAAPTAALAG